MIWISGDGVVRDEYGRPTVYRDINLYVRCGVCKAKSKAIHRACAPHSAIVTAGMPKEPEVPAKIEPGPNMEEFEDAEFD